MAASMTQGLRAKASLFGAYHYLNATHLLIKFRVSRYNERRGSFKGQSKPTPSSPHDCIPPLTSNMYTHPRNERKGPDGEKVAGLSNGAPPYIRYAQHY
ncbi:hypothetical protein K435DRAFT_974691 [Dendrothele bispora CBS 962.96]|uniref:Uncharacterized protein n=1 Tax=Dendrothele bispora (strain CBS 962.96) TaxID=1314807 RepID=A0A4S8KJU6_DENBC|nr:hypothetical protein K435DRAFT_974691 [Dendrothele bispora CBS 962.96]